MQLQEPKFGGSNGGTDKFIDFTLVLRIKEQLSDFIALVDVFLELFFVLYNMLQDQLFLGRVLSVLQIWCFVTPHHHFPKLFASLDLLVGNKPTFDLVLSEEGIVFEFAVHKFQILKYIIFNLSYKTYQATNMMPNKVEPS